MQLTFGLAMNTQNQKKTPTDSNRSQQTVSRFQLIIGAILFLAVLYVHAFVKELHILLLATPGLIMGIRLDALIDRILKR